MGRAVPARAPSRPKIPLFRNGKDKSLLKFFPKSAGRHGKRCEILAMLGKINLKIQVLLMLLLCLPV